MVIIGNVTVHAGSKLLRYFGPSMITVLLFSFAPIGLFLACVGLKDSWWKGELLNYSIVAVVMNLVALGVLVNFAMAMFSGDTSPRPVGRSRASIIATGHVQITVPSGWTENREIVAQHQGLLAVSDVVNDLHVSVIREIVNVTEPCAPKRLATLTCLEDAHLRKLVVTARVGTLIE